MLYLGEIPLLIALTRRTQRQSIDDIGISERDISIVKDRLKQASCTISITRDMTYRDFIACSLIGQFNKVNKGESL